MSDNNELKEFFDPILDVILKYENDYDSIVSLREEAETKLGKNWREVIAEYLVIYDESVKEEAEAKLSMALDYDGALLAWEEASYLINDESVTKEQIKDRYYDLKEWLQYFGEDGRDLIEKMQEKAEIEDSLNDEDYLEEEEEVTSLKKESEEKTPSSALEEHEEKGVRYKKKVLKLEDEDFAKKAGISLEVFWDFNAFLILNDYYDQTISRIGARCVRMGELSLNEYPYYGYVLDLLDEIITIGSNIEDEEKLVPLFEKYFENGYIGFKNSLKNYRKEFDENAPPEMISDDANELDRLIKELGAIDTSKVKDEEDLFSIGRARSEFDPIDDNDTSLPQAPPPPPVTSFKEMNSKKDEEE